MAGVRKLMGSITAWAGPAAALARGVGRSSAARIDVDRFVKVDAAMHLQGPRPDRTVSSLCTFDQLDSPRFRHWSHAIRETWRPHRKLWEH